MQLSPPGRPFGAETLEDERRRDEYFDSNRGILKCRSFSIDSNDMRKNGSLYERSSRDCRIIQHIRQKEDKYENVQPIDVNLAQKASEKVAEAAQCRFAICIPETNGVDSDDEWK